MNEPRSKPLTPAGQARREAMLGELVEVVKQTHRTRRLRRRVLGAGALVCVALLLMRLSLPVGNVVDDGARVVERMSDESDVVVPAEFPPEAVRVTVIVQTDPSVVERYRAEPTGLVVQIDDRMLLTTLASIGRPTGLIRFGDTLRLTAPVTDADLGLKR